MVIPCPASCATLAKEDSGCASTSPKEGSRPTTVMQTPIAQSDGIALERSMPLQPGQMSDGVMDIPGIADMPVIEASCGCIAMAAGAKPCPTRTNAKARIKEIARRL